MKIRTLVLAAALAAVPLSEARAQWDVPSFLAPRAGDDIGVYLSDLGDFGIQGIWRQTGNLNLGLRLGYIDTNVDGVMTIGAETWGMLARDGEALPMDVAWTAGFGAAFNGGTTAEVPVGLSIGKLLDAGTVAIEIYGHPRLALLFHSDEDGDGPPWEDRDRSDDATLEPLLDLGADFYLNESLKLRFGVTLGDIDALGVGLAYRWSRGAVVR